MRTANIIRSDDLRNENRRRVLSALRQHGPCTPARINQLTGLSAASISSLTSQMIEQGILISKRLDGPEPSARGRPQSQIMLKAEAGFVITLSLTIDLIKVQRVDYAGTLCDSREHVLDTRQLDRQSLVNALTEAIEAIFPDDDPDGVHHIGVSFQGITEHASGTLSWSPIIKETNVPLGRLLQERFSLPVSVNNDCRLIADGLSSELLNGSNGSFATILFSHGVGLGLYIDGQPFSGSTSSALELGHLRFERDGALCRCGKQGCIEAYAADYGIERLANGQSIHDIPAGRVSVEDRQELLLQAESGQRAAIQAFAIAGAAIGEGLASLFTLLDPMPVAFIGRNAGAFELMRKPLENTLARELRNSVDVSELFQCFEHADPLLERGLIKCALDAVDTAFAENN